jgi:hypothetical protein
MYKIIGRTNKTKCNNFYLKYFCLDLVCSLKEREEFSSEKSVNSFLCFPLVLFKMPINNWGIIIGQNLFLKHNILTNILKASNKKLRLAKNLPIIQISKMSFKTYHPIKVP